MSKKILLVAAAALMPVIAIATYLGFVVLLMGNAASTSDQGCSGPVPTVASSASPTPTSSPEDAQLPLEASPAGECGAGVSEGEAALPLKPGYIMTEHFGYRVNQVAGVGAWHSAVDLQNLASPCGDPVYAVLPGTVTLSSALYLSIKHSDGFVVSYLHMYKSQRLVDVGAKISAGQQIGVTGDVAPATGCHLDLRINVAANTNPDVAKLPIDPRMPGWVSPEAFMRLYGVELCDAACKGNF